MPLLERGEAEFVAGRLATDDLAVLERHLAIKRVVLLQAPTANWESRHLTDEHTRGIACVLLQNSNLDALELPRNRIGDVGAERIAVALPGSSALRSLWLSSNRIGDTGAIAIAAALPRLGWSAKRRALGDGNGGPRLEELWLSSNRIGDAGAAALAHALPEVRRLKKLDLRANRVGDAGASELSQALPKGPVLDDLYLQDNQIGDVGAAAIANVLGLCPWLVDLRLTGNRIADDGAAALANALPAAPTLRRLRLSGNAISDAGGTALARMLQATAAERAQSGGRNQLHRLELACNRLGDQTAAALAAAVPWTALLALDVEGHQMSMEAERRLALALLGTAVGVAVPYTKPSLAWTTPDLSGAPQKQHLGSSVLERKLRARDNARLASDPHATSTVRVWRLASGEQHAVVTEVPLVSHGIFFADECYAVLIAAGEGASRRVRLFEWHGRIATAAAKANAAQAIADVVQSVGPDWAPEPEGASQEEAQQEAHKEDASKEEKTIEKTPLLAEGSAEVTKLGQSGQAELGPGAAGQAALGAHAVVLQGREPEVFLRNFGGRLSTRGGSSATDAASGVPHLSLRQLHGVRLVSHVRSIGVSYDALRDETDNGVLLDELRRARARVERAPLPTKGALEASAERAAHGPSDTHRIHTRFPTKGEAPGR